MLGGFGRLFRRDVVRNEEAASVPLTGDSSEATGANPMLVEPKLSCVQYDNFAREWMTVSQMDTFDGFRVEVGKPLSKSFNAAHTLLLGTQQKGQPYAYQFGPVFQSEDGRLFVMGKTSLDGLLNARVVKKIWGPYCDIRANLTSCIIEPSRNMYEFSKDLNFKRWSTSTKLVWQGIWIMNFGFSSMISKSLHLGGEVTYLNLVHRGASMGTLGIRYDSGGNVCSATIGRTPDFKNPMRDDILHGVRMQYVRKISDRLSMGCEFDYSYPDYESAMKVGYEYTFRTSRVQGLLDTAGRVSCFINDFKGFALSGMIDYFHNDYKFGMLMHYFPAGENAEGGEGGVVM
ncbi:unnamed protein product [Amoebophrya sp. A25]|nr:unnamed protein product [Amoebophrya sp. A25]|eukprot:GSA25T00004269001.1